MSILQKRPRWNAVLAGTASIGLALTLTACGDERRRLRRRVDRRRLRVVDRLRAIHQLRGPQGQDGHRLHRHRDARGQAATSTPSSRSRSAPASTIKYEGDKAFETQILVRAKAGNPPDIAYRAAARPAQAAGGDRQGRGGADGGRRDNVDKFCGKDWKAYGTVDGKFYAAPLGANVKSLVWYSPKEFKDTGYKVPTTLDELKALSDKIVADGKKPWCAGIASGEATGWPVTDWMEDMMLRLSGPETYDKWVNHEIPFNGPEATAALDAVGAVPEERRRTSTAVYGDVKSIATTTFQDAGLPILDGTCSLHRQASFYAANWAEGHQGGRGRRRLRVLPAGQGRQRPSRCSAAASSSPRSPTGPRSRRSRPTCPATPGPTPRPTLGAGLGQRQQGPRPEQADQPDRQAGGDDPAGPERGVPLRRLGPDAGRGRLQRVLEAGDELDHRSGHQDDGGQHREGLAEVI